MFSFKSLFGRRERKRTSTRPTPIIKRRYYVPSFEILENRLAPATITVLGTTDGNGTYDSVNHTDTTLRGAITNATAGDTIVFTSGLSGAINLSTSSGGLGVLTLSKNLTINGSGATITVEGGSSSGVSTNAQVFSVSSGVTITLQDLTISNGFKTGNGGGIVNSGNLTITSCTISNNEAFNSSSVGNVKGGGVYNSSSGQLTINSSTISGNTTSETSTGSAYAGGLCNDQGTATINDTSITGNTLSTGGHGSGAGVANVANPSGSATMTLNRCTISGNTMTGTGHYGYGGGIFNRTQAGSLSVNYTTISGNTVNGFTHTDGGGLFSNGLSATLTNCTVAGNSTTIVSGGTASDGGAGLSNFSGTLSLVNCTVASNTDSTAKGGFYVNGGTVNLINTIFSGNTNSSGALDITRGQGTVNATNCLLKTAVTAGSGNTINGTNTNNLFGTDPLLGSLQNNGGTTQTMALAENSPAIDAGTNSVLSSPYNLTTDQRGAAREIGSVVDIGAYEYIPSITVTSASEGSGTISSNNGDSTATDTTLRGAIAYVGPSGSITYDLGVSGTTTLTSELDLLNSMSITGPGSSSLTLNAGSTTFRAFDIPSGVTASISGFTIANGKVTGAQGGGIYNLGTLTLSSSTLSGNVATKTLSSNGFGGGLYNGGTATVQACTFSGTNTAYQGGGMFNGSGATLTLENSTVTGNTASYGGGVYNWGSAILANSTFSSNTASGNGGGVYAGYTGGNNSIPRTTIQNCTISGNASSNTSGNNGGGGVFGKSPIFMENTTIYGNTASRYGAGFFELYQSDTLVNCTIAGNTTTSKGGGVALRNGILTLKNTILSGNTDSTSTSKDFFRLPVSAGGGIANAYYSLIQNGTINGTSSHCITGSSANLGTLQDNGGPVKTMALSSSSPAINAGNNALTLLIGSAPTISLSSTATGSGLNAGTYYYQVSAVTFQGETAASAEKSITTASAGTITVSWTKLDLATGYDIYRASSSGAETLIATVNALTSSYTDMGTVSTPTGSGMPRVYDTALLNTDARGFARVANNTANTTYIVDMGAYEYNAGFGDALSNSSGRTTLGANWTVQTTSPTGSFSVNSNGAVSGGSGYDEAIALSSTLTQADISVGVHVSFLTSGLHMGGVLARKDASNNYYYGLLYDYTTLNVHAMLLGRFVGNTNDPILLASVNLGSSGATSGDVRLDVVGTTLRLYLNGTLEVSATDSTLTAGAVGIIDGPDNTAFTNFFADGLVTVQAEYADNFSRSASNSLRYPWQVSDGGFTINSSNQAVAASLSLNVASVYGPSGGSLLEQTTMSGFGGGLVADWNNATHSGYAMILTNATTLTLYRVTGGALTSINTWTVSANTGNNTLALTTNGATLTPVLDGTTLSAFTDSLGTYTSGAMGIASTGSTVFINFSGNFD
jgi:hypothetical protein